MGHRGIIVIGGSAGSLQVLRTILPALPWDFPAAVFVVLHTSEDSPGLLPEILNRGSKLPVMYAVHGADILPARVYIAPAGQRHMLLDRGRVRLEPGPRENRSRPSIDALFRSASYAYGNQVIAVVLSGNLDDGSAGVLAIKNRGGMAIAQDPDEALAPSMPASAIEATDVDFILPVEQIGPKLVELAPIESTERVRVISTGDGNMSATGQTYACPECGGVLEEAKEGGMLRFRCRVGHMYSPESLLAEQTEAVEKALWAAIRSMEEQAEFSDRLADTSRQKKRPRLAHRFTEKAGASRENATILRDLLQRTSDEVLEIPLEDGKSEYEERTGTD
jgi:two-component system, chemotaxis family, protein-glutamate methylesterase/glutaminase